MIRRVLLPLLLALAVLTSAPMAAHAASGGAWWKLNATAAPTLLPHKGEALIVLTATNLGDLEVLAQHSPVTLRDTLPAGVTPVRTTNAALCHIASQTVTCTIASGTVAPYRFLQVGVDGEPLVIVTETELSAESTGPLENVVQIQGGETPSGEPVPSPPALSQPLALAPSANSTQQANEMVPFGVEAYAMTPEGEAGEPQVQAGSHPFQLTTLLNLNQLFEPDPGSENPGAGRKHGEAGGGWPSAPALPRDLHFKLPAGLLGDPTATPRCTSAQFELDSSGLNRCPASSAAGVVTVTAFDPGPYLFFQRTLPVFNLAPAPGEPARFGFIVEEVPIIIKTSVPAGGDYGVQVSVEDVSQAISLLSSQLTLWGVPADPRHNNARGWEPPAEPASEPSEAFLTLPTACQSAQTSVSGDSWAAGNAFGSVALDPEHTTYTLPTPQGCEALAFNPALTIEPESHSASTPTGLNVGVEMPQPGLLAPAGEAEAALKQTTVKLPAGLQLSPAAANALADCTAREFDFLNQYGDPFEGPEEPLQTGNETTPSGPANCSGAAKVGTVSITTPLLPHELTGSVYLAAQNVSPFKSPLAIYLLAEDPEEGIRVKLAGSVEPDPGTGQLTSTFKNTPQLPFTALHLHFFGGERASLTTPPACGTATSTSEFVPWSTGVAPVTPEPAFQITSGAGGGPCPPSPLSFSPSFKAGPGSPQAGTVSPIFVDIGHPDGDQALNGIGVTEPPGFAAILASVEPCPEPPAGQEWACGEDSHIGEVKEYAGLGSEPVVLTGQAYLTSGYDGAPFGLLVRTLAAAGPFNLGWVNVRSKIEVNPNTAVVSVTSDPGPRGEAIPTILDGVPVQLKALEVAVNRPGFTFGPTNCDPMSFTGTLNGAEGAADPVSTPFTAENCQGLAFHPGFEASTGGHGSKVDGTNLNVKVTSQGLGVANIQKVDLQFPKALSSRLTTLQKACTEAAFNANPASCDPDSVIGHATVQTPILKNPLTGPAYLVSHGGAAFPDVEFVLQSEGITIVLDGKTDIKNGITYSKFETAPDAPFTTFETELPSGPDSIFTANVPEAKDFDLCGENLEMPTTIVAQDGAKIEQSTKIAVQGCGAVKSSKVKKLSLAQRFNKALAQCRKQYKHSKSKRARCESKAHARYTTLAMAACRKSDKHSRKKLAACQAQARRRFGATTARGR